MFRRAFRAFAEKNSSSRSAGRENARVGGAHKINWRVVKVNGNLIFACYLSSLKMSTGGGGEGVLQRHAYFNLELARLIVSSMVQSFPTPFFCLIPMIREK